MPEAKNWARQFQVFSYIGILLILMWGIVACGDNNQGNTPTRPIPKVTLVAKDFSFDMPATLPAGLVDITMSNVGVEPHQASLAQLKQGVTQDQVLAALSKSNGSTTTAESLLTYMGGPSIIVANQSQEVILTLSPGQYVAICALRSKDHVSHVAKGMIKFFQVTGLSSDQTSQPVAQGTVILKEYSFVLPGSLKAGPTLLKVTNEGAVPHQIAFIKRAPGKTTQDITDFFEHRSDTIPFERSGGMSTLSTGQSGWIQLDLQPGNYVALCITYDPATKLSHFKMGMISSFTVQ